MDTAVDIGVYNISTVCMLPSPTFADTFCAFISLAIVLSMGVMGVIFSRPHLVHTFILASFPIPAVN